MRDFDERLTSEAELLDEYLYQYKDCISRKNALVRRRTEIQQEFDCPLSGINYDGLPHGNGISVGSAAISYRLDEIDTKIKGQMQKAEKLLSDIMNVIDFLDEQSLERSIIENRYIDRMGWNAVCRENHASRSKVNRYWKKGLYELLEFKKVKKILRDFQKSREV